MISAPPKKRETGFFREVWVQTNRILEYARAVQVRQNGSLGVKVSQTNNGTLLKVDALRATGTEAKQFRLVSVQDDYYICREWDGENAGSADINIAKQHELRRTGWHGQTIIYAVPAFPGSPGQLQVTYNYLAADYRTASYSSAEGAVVEHELIQPILRTNQTVIFAIKASNGTGVDDADDWIEFGPRAWARVAKVIG